MRGRLAGHGAAVMHADPAFLLCGDRWWCGRDGVVAEAVFEEVEDAFGVLPAWFCVAVAAFEVDPEDADQPGGGDERLDGVGGAPVSSASAAACSKRAKISRWQARSAGLLRTKAGTGVWVRLTARLLPAPLTSGPGWLCPWLPGGPGFREWQAGRRRRGRWR
jgi:hypothetical protein